MDVLPLISTIVGAAIGIGSTLLADRTRWARDRRDRVELAQHQLRADFIAAVARSADIVWNVAHHDQPPTEDGNRGAQEAFREADLYTWRYRIALSSPSEIVAASETLLDALRHYRNTVAAGERKGSTQYSEARSTYFAAVAEAINVLRGTQGRLPFLIRQSERRARADASNPAGRFRAE
ncbi:hypothetical protein DEJ48_39185 [Streptomyces venezuelae]|uniref:Uncharacterized protein n=1 Tax=Streptomyces venezuelae TaxID=54571 RepID=A0A5P2C773_STRVZ|nr:hypothetical protein [Streptomyces venezuelae]QES38625.1 hypothetical protein DEJ48_39185 [Streptomyces venezuelae]